MILSNLDAQRKSNPIMVINCADAAAAKTKALKVNESCSEGNCPEGFVCYLDYCYPACPVSGPVPGTVCVDGAMVPDCAVSGCSECDGEAYWNPSSAACICDEGSTELVAPSFGYVCGCPEYTETEIITSSDGAFGGCVGASECYSGDISFTIQPFTCVLSGSITTTIFISVPIRLAPLPTLALTLVDLENCELTNDQNFVQQLAEVYGTNFAFVDDDRDGIIEIEFERDPSLPVLIDFANVDDIMIPACLTADDPCSCSNPLNQTNPDGSVIRFHDILAVTGTPGQMVTLVANNNPTGFTDATGTPIAALTVLGTIPAGGTLEYEFYRSPAPGGAVDIVFQTSPLFDIIFTSDCPLTSGACVTTTPIPTLGQWAVVLLGVGFLLIGFFLVKRIF